jgi:hypothetical protein
MALGGHRCPRRAPAPYFRRNWSAALYPPFTAAVANRRMPRLGSPERISGPVHTAATGLIPKSPSPYRLGADGLSHSRNVLCSGLARQPTRVNTCPPPMQCVPLPARAVRKPATVRRLPLVVRPAPGKRTRFTTPGTDCDTSFTSTTAAAGCGTATGRSSRATS